MSARSVPTNSDAVRRARQLAGFECNELAKRLGISPGYMSAIECGKNPSPKLLRRIAEATGAKYIDLVAAELRNAA